MIKLTYTGGNPPSVMWFNPAQVLWVSERADHTCNIRLRGGDTYQVRESGDVINEQMLAWQHRTHQ
jgi:hypothetical protein